MKLISMTDFVLEQKETETFDTSQIMWYDKEVDKLVKIRNYADFLKQPLELWMFVPCDENGVLFENTERVHFSTHFDYVAELEVYKDAVGRVLFAGFSVKYKEETNDTFGVYTLIKENTDFIKFQKGNKIYIQPKNTIECLVKHNLQLTATAKKQLGL